MKPIMKIFVGLIALSLSTGVCFAVGEEKQAAPVAGQEDSQKIHEVQGTIDEINLDKRSLTLQKEGETPASEKPMKFVINDKTSITSGGRAMSLEELAAGTAVKITYEKPWFGFLGSNSARSIECQ